ncbi:hypothetical protein SAMN05216212_2789 [Microbulbifer yueqingensis]|uniref:Uncharacterized protein n=2 Tax=Microbulbifer yueqingensis TaxID=658219 RepID=A0A1G9DG11_9GAMM|nr:hypothetical protein SAMN05216212_2789 [Microbulbifer yueqingensis]
MVKVGWSYRQLAAEVGAFRAEEEGREEKSASETIRKKLGQQRETQAELELCIKIIRESPVFRRLDEVKPVPVRHRGLDGRFREEMRRLSEGISRKLVEAEND